MVELALGFYFTFAVITCINEGIWLTLPFLMLFQYGYLYISFLSFSTIFKNKFVGQKSQRQHRRLIPAGKEYCFCPCRCRVACRLF